MITKTAGTGQTTKSSREEQLVVSQKPERTEINKLQQLLASCAVDLC